MKMISKQIDEGVLTINEERKRFHILAIGKNKKLLFKNGKKIINEMKKKGYNFVPFEDCCEPGDEIEIHDKNGNIEKYGFADIGFGKTSEYSLKQQKISDNDQKIIKELDELIKQAPDKEKLLSQLINEAYPG